MPYDQDLAIRYSPLPIHQLCVLAVLYLPTRQQPFPQDEADRTIGTMIQIEYLLMKDENQ